MREVVIDRLSFECKISNNCNQSILFLSPI